MIALSQEWSLLSPYTAFLVLESDSQYAQYGIDRRRRHRYWQPAEASPGEDADHALSGRATRPDHDLTGRASQPLPADWVQRIAAG